MAEHITNEGLQASLTGLERYLKSEFENIQRQLTPLSDAPVKLERLAANHEALAGRVEDLEEENDSKSNKFFQWLTIAIAVSVGLGSIAVNLIQVLHA